MSPQLLTLAASFTLWLYLPELGPLLVALATVAGNRIEGGPIWLQLIGPPGCGKTEIVVSMAGQPDIYLTGDLTKAGLLSGTSFRERHSSSTGGLLRQIGDFGVIACKDFTTILSMHREGRQDLLGLLRDTYDGLVVRNLGTDGGMDFVWRGKAGFLGACTGTIDRHHAVMATMGERFLFYRMPTCNEDEEVDRALDHAGAGKEMQAELSNAVGKFFQQIQLPQKVEPAQGEDRDRLKALASLVARARSAVERDSYHRNIELVPESERPNRIIIALDRLRAGLLSIGLEPAEAWPLVEKVGFDCLPVVRGQLLRLLRQGENLMGGRATELIGCSATTVERHVEDLRAHGVLRRGGGPWALSDWAESKLAILEGSPEKSGTATTPEKSDGASRSPDMSPGPPETSDMSDEPPSAPEMSGDMKDVDDFSEVGVT